MANLQLEDIHQLEYVPYGNTGTKAYLDSKTNTYYNSSGQTLRSPLEYDDTQEGYTPFGDE